MLTENETTELKREYVDDIKKTVIAFANTNGGVIYIGINDDGTIYGVPTADDTLLRAANAVRDGIRPDVTLFTKCAAENLEDKEIITVSVQRGTARPYYLAGKGLRPEGVFLRQGASTVPASESAILSMIKETGGDSFEEARSREQQLTFDKLSSYFAKKELPFGEPQKKTLGLIGCDGDYTNAALLLSDQCPHTIKLAVFEGGRKSVFKDRHEASGSLIGQIEEAFDYISRYNRTRSEIHGLERVDMPDYPACAIREALLNAVVHRDYSLSGSTLISIFDDRIEFVSIGGLAKGISYNDIMLGISITRNKKLADIFYRLNLIEAYGTGILKIRESCAVCGTAPLIEVSDNGFKITLPNANFNRENTQTREEPPAAPLRPNERAALALTKERGAISRSELQELMKISQATAITLLRGLTAKGLLKKERRGRAVFYSLV
ncbi:MAG: putative DNA binding domain-containing protein [Cloacibacillus sp.]